MSSYHIPSWDTAHPKDTAYLAIAVLLGTYFIRDLTDIGEMDRHVHGVFDSLMDSMVREITSECGSEMMDQIDIELSDISLATPVDHELIQLCDSYGTSWAYRYDALHPLFVKVCADLRVRLARARVAQGGADKDAEPN